jgi:peptide/nickel transport system permease protein
MSALMEMIPGSSRARARRRGRVGVRFRGLGTLGLIAAIVIVVFVLGAVLAPLIAPYKPNAIDFGSVFAGPSSSHLLGTDSLGRDLFSRLLYGGRSGMLGPLLVISISTFLGTTFALIGAWRGGTVDLVIARAFDVIFAFPGILLAILAVAIFGAGLETCVVALSISYVPYLGRIIRSAALRERAQPYVTALSLHGLSGWWICGRHLLRNVTPTIVAQATVSFGYAMVDLAALSFLGLGVQAPTADWGLMVSDGQQSLLQNHPAESIYAGACIVIVVTAFNILGERLGDRAARVG